MPACRFEEVSPRVDRFTPDERTDRPVLGAIRGTAGTLIVDGGASPAHLAAFAAELEARDRPPIIGIALLIGGVVVTESVYAIPGLGRLTVDAVLARDFPTIQGVILFFSLVYVVINLLVDLSYVFFDPRIRS